MIEQPLRGWKDIGAFLGTSARSAQRWEREFGMPVHRLRASTGSVVSAYPSELDAWRRRLTVGPVSTEAPDEDADDLTGGCGEPEGMTPLAGPHAAQEGAALPPRPTGARFGWLMLGALVAGLALGAGWLWRSSQPTSAPGVSADATGGGFLRASSGDTTVRILPGADGLATLAMPGLPQLSLRVVPSGSELTLEISRMSVVEGRSPRLAQLRLTPDAPADLRVPGGAAVRFEWEGARQIER